MIIILEGPDGAGKTTLARQLVERYDLEYRHEGPPPETGDTLSYYGAILDAYRGKNVVFDRLALGETIYGPILRSKDRLGQDGLRVFRRLVRAVGAVEVICLPRFTVALANWTVKRALNDLVQDHGQYTRLYELYQSATVGHGVYCYDYEVPNAERDLITDLEFTRPTLPTNVTGSPAARFLLVGDAGSDPYSPTTNLAFFGTTHSSGYLTQALNAAGFQERELAFVNARLWHALPVTESSPNALFRLCPHDFSAAATGRVVIALGSEAAARCERLKLTYLKIPHPQFWKRFHHNDVTAYAGMLKEIRDAHSRKHGR